MIIFIIIAQYIRLKQRCLVLEIQKSMSNKYNKVQFTDNQNKIKKFKSFLWNKFMLANVRYSHLYEEMAVYNQFWISFISVIYVLYLGLFAYMIYVILIDNSDLKFFYILIFLVSLILLGLITYICGCVVQQQVQYYKHFTSIVLRSDVVYPKHVHNKFKVFVYFLFLKPKSILFVLIDR